MRTLSILALALALSACGAQTPDASRLASDGVKLKVLSLNAFLLDADANGKPSLAQRLALLPDAIAATGADVVVLQEVWSVQNRTKLAELMAQKGYAVQMKETPSILPPYHYGNGLQIYVKAPLQFASEPKMSRFTTLINFDNFTTKGTLQSVVAVPGFGNVDVFGAHTSFLPFKSETHDFDLTQEPKLLAQTQHILAQMDAGASAVRILGMDFNTHPYKWDAATRSWQEGVKSKPYGLLTDEGGLKDAMAEAADVACGAACWSWDGLRNGLIKQGMFGGVPGDTTDPLERIDYVLYSGAAKAVSARLALEDEHDVTVQTDGVPVTKALPLSDHFGVLTELVLGAP